jgi:nucleotide-binding universal stress UspA family protein
MKTLMATDGSSEATAALKAASRILRRNNNDIDLLCVAPEYLPGRTKKEGHRRIFEEYKKRISRETGVILEQSRQVLIAEGVESRPISRIGSPSDEIIRLADEYDVTVVGARSRYNRSELGLGPVASRVVEHAPGAVLLARELSGDSPFRVLVGLDGSIASKHALKAMIAYFEIDEAEITLMHVVEMPWISLGLEREWFDDRGDVFLKSDPETQLENELRLEAEEVIEQAHSVLEDRSYSVMSLITEGNPATEILGEAETKDYDLIVLGTSGVADTKHTLLGSVSAKVAWNASCSVALVKYAE